MASEVGGFGYNDISDGLGFGYNDNLNGLRFGYNDNLKDLNGLKDALPATAKMVLTTTTSQDFRPVQESHVFANFEKITIHWRQHLNSRNIW